MEYKFLIDDKELNIDLQLLDQKAEEIYTEISGLNSRSGRKFERMKEDSFRVLSEVREKISITAECRVYDNVELQGCDLIINGTVLSCSAFELLTENMLEGIYLYVISTGDFSMPGAKVIDQLYADFWGNAYTDALRRIFIEELEKTSPISDSFGPGFYGMETCELVKLGQLLDFESKGISVKNGQVMVPLKSCAGIIFKVNDKYRKLDAECESCLGNQRSCSMCIVNRSR